MKKKIIITIVSLSVVIFVGFVTYDKQISYDKYSKITHDNTIININN